MAKATVEKRVVEEIKSVTLTLSKDEAYAVSAVLGKVSGSTEHSYRKYSQQVYNALIACGFNNYSFTTNVTGIEPGATICFTDKF